MSREPKISGTGRIVKRKIIRIPAGRIVAQGRRVSQGLMVTIRQIARLNIGGNAPRAGINVQTKPANAINAVATAASDKIINVTWSAGVTGETPTSYTCEKENAGLGNWTLIYTGATPVTSSTGLAAGTGYRFRIRAFNGTSPSDGYAIASATTQPGFNEGAATKIVQPNGAGGAFTTIQAAFNAAVAGDIIELRSNTPGTLTTRSENIAVTGKNGNAAAYIQVRVRTGDRYLLKGPGASAIIRFTNCSYWEFDGNGSEADDDDRREHLRISDFNAWDPVTTNGLVGPHTRTLELFACHHFKLRGMKAHGNGTGSLAIFPRRDCYKLYFEDCEFSGHGTNNSESGAGDVFRNFAEKSVFKNCKFRWGGHFSFQLLAPLCVVRDCDLDGNWTPLNTGYPGEETFLIGSGHYDDWSPTSSINNIVTANRYVFGPTVLERCRIRDSGFSVHIGVTGTSKMDGFRCIERGNIWTDFTQAPAIGMDAFNKNTSAGNDGNTYPSPAQGSGYVYHNTYYELWGIINVAGNNFTTPPNPPNTREEYRFKNEIYAQLHTNTQPNPPDGNRGVVYWKMQTVPPNGWPNKWKGTVFDGIMFQGDASKMAFELDEVEKTIAGTDANSAKGTWPANIKDVRTQAAALSFANVGTPSNRTLAGLTLTSGPGFQEAAALTTTTAAGSSTTNLPVADAWYFTDYENPLTYDLTEFGEQNDWIAVGTTLANAVLVQIATINSKTSITLKTPITYIDGAKVWFAGNPGYGETQAVWKNWGAGQ